MTSRNISAVQTKQKMSRGQQLSDITYSHQLHICKKNSATGRTTQKFREFDQFVYKGSRNFCCYTW